MHQLRVRRLDILDHLVGAGATWEGEADRFPRSERSAEVAGAQTNARRAHSRAAGVTLQWRSADALAISPLFMYFTARSLISPSLGVPSRASARMTSASGFDDLPRELPPNGPLHPPTPCAGEQLQRVGIESVFAIMK